jgi:alkanesulfonate monooxygenase SsuD/methylene tetrahydromethanopterin reductase-like flavin-dependent oxidoreductase (luciferase family)
MIAQLRQFAKDAGRDPQSLEVIVGANISLSEKPLGADRAIFTGSEDQVKDDIKAVKKLGADEIFFVIFQEESIKDLVATMEKLRSFL